MVKIDTSSLLRRAQDVSVVLIGFTTIDMSLVIK